MTTIIDIAMWIVGIYLLCGLLFAVPFVIKGVKVIDPNGAHGTRWGFRVIILPGTVIFWPVLIGKWVKAKRGQGV